MKENNKGDKEGMRVFEKGISTRQNRAGVIREINTIKPSKRNEVALYQPEGAENIMGGKKKLNIFDQQDANTLKNETLARLGFGGSTEIQPY